MSEKVIKRLCALVFSILLIGSMWHPAFAPKEGIFIVKLLYTIFPVAIVWGVAG